MKKRVIGTISEVKNNENRVGLTPEGVKQLVADGHTVLVQRHAGKGTGFHDRDYIDAGAEIMLEPEQIIQKCDILVKVKEPLEQEYPLLELMHGKTLFTYLHLSGVPKSLTDTLLKEEITGIAYETVKGSEGGLPLLAPMSEVAGVLAVQYGAEFLQKKHGGRGKTLGEITGTKRSHVVVIGGGVVGQKSAQTAAGMGSLVTLLDISKDSLIRAKDSLTEKLGDKLVQNITFTISDESSVNEALADADVLIGAVLVPGARAPKVITAGQIHLMKDGAVVVDVSIDQGGCIEGSRATSHSEPIYMVDGKIFCCVGNMPGQAAYQSTQALTTATFPYLRKLASADTLLSAFDGDPGFQMGVNTYGGRITFEPVAKDLGMTDKYMDLEQVVEKSGQRRELAGNVV